MTLPGVLALIVNDPGSAALVTDFDGTLAPIVEDPSRARPVPAAVDALRALVGHVTVVGVVSGRPIEFLRPRLPVPGLTLVGQYGLERLVGDEVVVDERALAYGPAVAAAAAEAERRWPRLLVERKGTLAFTVHWRAVPDAAPTPGELGTLADAHGLVVGPGRMAGEVRVPLRVDKGSALSRLLDGQPVRTCAYAGDDHGDLPAFSALADRVAAQPGFGAVRIAVSSPEVPPQLVANADLVVESPADLAQLLATLAQAVSEPR